MNQPTLCSRCHEEFIPRGYSRYGQICPWCEQSMIVEEHDLCHQLGILPMTELDVLNYLKYWDDPVLFPTV